jgi:hypothetical protein
MSFGFSVVRYASACRSIADLFVDSRQYRRVFKSTIGNKQWIDKLKLIGHVG